MKRKIISLDRAQVSNIAEISIMDRDGFSMCYMQISKILRNTTEFDSDGALKMMLHQL